MGGGGSQRLLCLNPTSVMVVLLLLLGCDNNRGLRWGMVNHRWAKFWFVELFEWFVFHNAIYILLALQNTGSFGLALVSDGWMGTHTTLCI